MAIVNPFPVGKLFPLFGLLFLVSCGDSGEPVEKTDLVRPIKMVTVTTGDSSQTYRFPATIEAGRIADLSFTSGGVLKEVRVAESQEVKAGDIIATLDSANFQSQLEQAEAAFKTADDEYQRGLRLQKEDAIAVNVVEQRKSQRQVAKAQLDSAQKAMNDTQLQAPFNGRIAKVSVEQSASVGAGQAIVTLIGEGDLEAGINLPANYIAKAKNRTDGSGSITLDALPNKKIPITYKEATLIADASSQTYRVNFSFITPGDLIILPGMNATIELSSHGSAGESEIVVPLSSVLSDGESRYVWVIDQDTMAAAKNKVTVRAGIGEMVVVTEGLKTGDIIAGAGASYLAEGMIVRPWSSAK